MWFLFFATNLAFKKEVAAILWLEEFFSWDLVTINCGPLKNKKHLVEQSLNQ